MKILRILRRRKIKLSFILLLLVFFIFNTYAWMRTDTNTETGNISLTVSDWDVQFMINDEEVKTEEYTFEIPEFHPGIDPIEKEITIYNIGDANSFIKYEITDIYLYGEQIYRNEVVKNEVTSLVPETLGIEAPDSNGLITADVFGNDDATIFEKGNTNYSFSLRYPTPFTISYTYDRTHVSGKEFAESAIAKMTINLAWYDEEENNEEDTKLGTMAYEFANAVDEEGNLLHEGEPALKIVAKITATREFQ